MKYPLNFVICIVHIFKILDLLILAFICIPYIAFCVYKFQHFCLVNRENNVFSLHKFILFPQVLYIGSLLRVTRIRENIENTGSQVTDKGWSPNLKIRLIVNTLPSENPDKRKSNTIPVILVDRFSCLFSFQFILWSYHNVVLGE